MDQESGWEITDRHTCRSPIALRWGFCVQRIGMLSKQAIGIHGTFTFRSQYRSPRKGSNGVPVHLAALFRQ